MKKIKVSLFAVAAIFLAVCASALTSPQPQEKNLLDGWFIYNGGPLNNPNSYSYTTDISPCNAHVRFCAFKGTQQTSVPSRPTQQSLDDAMAASENFAQEVDDVVVFKP